ncbi:MAG: hypothetical protein DDT22_00899 [candidate division WS2 bacterium]|nr:hypothetical protein [Candidatus Lithacetigena glycinireducens]
MPAEEVEKVNPPEEEEKEGIEEKTPMEEEKAPEENPSPQRVGD